MAVFGKHSEIFVKVLNLKCYCFSWYSLYLLTPSDFDRRAAHKGCTLDYIAALFRNLEKFKNVLCDGSIVGLSLGLKGDIFN